MEHRPVLAREVVDLFEPALGEGGVVVDATLGRGGHSAELLAAFPRCNVIGIDRDPEALAASRAHLASYGDRVRFARDNFEGLASVLERLGIETVRGVLFDLGVSSPQLDEASRGFSFRNEGPLDMRMDPDQRLSAYEVVNGYAVGELEKVISLYGEERFARRIARSIVRRRPITTTTELADVVKLAIPAATRRTGGHPARRTFQGIRIEVNAELRALESGLDQAISALEPGGRVVVISYHSLEDRIVKRRFADAARGCVCPPDLPVCRCGARATLRVLTRRPVRPTEKESARNPRAEAAKLRAAERIVPDEMPVDAELRSIA